MSEISEKDIRASARQIIARLRETYPAANNVRDDGQLEQYIVGLVKYYPPGEPNKPGYPCEHGFDDNFWCIECNPTP